MRQKGEIGKRGEDIAAEYLLQLGMALLARNWRVGHKELDLVMDDGEFIRFVEVRSRNYPNFIDPLESVTLPKRKNIILAARSFMAQGRREGWLPYGREVVFDIVSIIFNGKLFSVKYVKDAFAPWRY